MQQQQSSEPRHCDDYIKDKSQPKCLRKFLLHNRIPAYWKYTYWKKSWGNPTLYAKVEFDTLPPKIAYDLKKMLAVHKKETSTQVRVVMASRFGDVGITTNLDADHGYDARVFVEWLKDFTETI